MLIKKNTVELSDSILGFFSPPTVKDYQELILADRQHSVYTSENDPPVFSISFEVDPVGQKI